MPEPGTPLPVEENTDARGLQSTTLRREQARLLRRIEEIRRVQELGPSEAPPGMSDRELSQRLLYDMLATLTRGEIVLQDACEALIEHTEEQRAHNQLQAEELDRKRRELAKADAMELDDRQRRNQVFGIFVVPASALGGFLAKVLADQRLITIVVTAITTGISILVAGWGLGARLPE